MNEPVVVTGASGFLARHVIRALSRAGHPVIGLARRPPGAVVEGCDLRIFDGVDPGSVLPSGGPWRAVINLATAYGRDGRLGDVGISNLAMPLRLMDAAMQRGCRRWIEAGSYFAAAPNHGTLPAYVLSKRQLREWGAYFCAPAGMAFSVAEFHHLYGPGDRVDKFVPRLIAACRAGGDVPLTAGDQLRDFIHVADAASAVLAMLEQDAAPGAHLIPVGTGQATTIRAFAELVVELTGGASRLRIGALPYPRDEQMSAVADASALHAMGWRPAYDLRAGLADTLEG